MSDAWDGRPADPEKDGWHWLEALPVEGIDGEPARWAVHWVAKHDLWNDAYPPAYAIGKWRYVSPCAAVTPPRT
jgi:hypothetical protein